MSEVEFEEEYTRTYMPKKIPSPSLFVKLGIAKNETQAGVITFITIIVCIIISGFFIVRTFNLRAVDGPIYREDLKPGVFEKLPPELQNDFPSKYEK